MEWIKIPTDSILHTDLKDKELITIIRYQALYSQLEIEPNLIQLKRLFSSKQITFIEENKQIVDGFIKKHIEKVCKKRNNDKERYNKKQALSENSANLKPAKSKLTPLTDKTRLDKIREEKRNKISFGDFYSIYPVKKSKVKAEEKWYKLNLQDQTSCITHLRSSSYKSWLLKQDKQYIPHPSTFLNQRRWEDQLDNKPPVKKRALFVAPEEEIC